MSNNASMTLTEFLDARIDEDESLARAARRDAQERDYSPESDALPEYGENDVRAVTWTPSRVLAECAAKRKALALHEQLSDHDYDGALDHLQPIIQAMANVYSDHADYRSEWTS